MEDDASETTRSPEDGIVEFDPATESASETVMNAVTARTGIPGDELDPLEVLIEEEALDALIRSVATRSDSTYAEVTLEYHGYTVTVYAYGAVEVAPTSPD